MEFEPFIPVAIFATAWFFFTQVLNQEWTLEEIRIRERTYENRQNQSSDYNDY